MEQPRHRGGGPWYLVIGLAAIGFGVFLLRISGSAEFKAPPYVGWACAALFGGAGLLMLAQAGARYLRRRRRARQLAWRPDEPWLADHAWDPWGERDRPWSRIVHMLHGVCWVGLFAVVANAIGFGENLWPFMIGAVILDIILVALVFGAVRRFARVLRFGTGYLRYERFPYRPGEPLKLRLGLPGDLDAVDCTLRYVEEKYVQHGNEKRLRRDTVYEDKQRVEDPGREPRVTFALPDDARSTELAAEPPRYWELAVVAERAGLDYKAVFLVPVYATATAATHPIA